MFERIKPKHTDFGELRRSMVEHQIVRRGVGDPNVIKVIKSVPRHKFVPVIEEHRAYGDFPVTIGEGQTISQPYMVALMTECLRLKKEDIVLEIGTGSGYQTAILAELAQHVYTVERIASLSHKAEKTLRELNYANIDYSVSDGAQGWPDKKIRFDAVMITAAAPNSLKHLLELMNLNGRMVIPIGDRFSQTLTLLIKKENAVTEERICQCVFVPLIGAGAWN